MYLSLPQIDAQTPDSLVLMYYNVRYTPLMNANEKFLIRIMTWHRSLFSLILTDVQN